MEKITPFDIPLLTNEISQYLSRKDLARCVLVSKAWSAWFAPALWRDVDGGYWAPDVATLARQQEHIRVVRDISMNCNSDFREQLASLRLQRVMFKDGSNGKHRVEIRVLQVLERISTLQHIEISLSLDLDHIHHQLIRTLEALPCLESLTLSCLRLVNGMFLLEVLQACRGLQFLSLELLGDEEEFEEKDRQEYRDARLAIEKMPEMRLRELVLDSYVETVMENIFQPLLGRCPRLEKLDLQNVQGVGSLENAYPSLWHLGKALKGNRLPKLQRLALDQDLDIDYGPSEMIFDGILSHIACGLDSLVLSGFDGEVLVPLLIRYHSRSLTRLDILDTPISLYTLSELMAGLPCLRTVKAEIDEDEYDDDDIVLDRDWKCVDLKSLQLDLGIPVFYYNLVDDEWKRSAEKVCLDYVFSQAAKLRSLQELDLRCELDMYRKFGYLKQLVGLKQLKVLDLTHTIHRHFRKQDALWMAKNWPKLLRVRGRDLSEVFKRTLLEKRPLVEIGAK